MPLSQKPISVVSPCLSSPVCRSCRAIRCPIDKPGNELVQFWQRIEIVQLRVPGQLNRAAPVMVDDWFGQNEIVAWREQVGSRASLLPLNLPQANNQRIAFVGHSDTISTGRCSTNCVNCRLAQRAGSNLHNLAHCLFQAGTTPAGDKHSWRQHTYPLSPYYLRTISAL